ncbi:MAG: YicC/YloC family endoribonuclease [Solitalea-like symbiont of Acarus siro]
MLKSMTGFVMTVNETKYKKITVEIKSLTHKFIETNHKIPNIFTDTELEIKNECIKSLGRGKIYLTINIEDTNAETSACLNIDLISKYYNTLSKLAEQLNAKTANLFESVLALPEVVKSTTASLDKKDSDWQLLKKTLADALVEINKYRSLE